MNYQEFQQRNNKLAIIHGRLVRGNTSFQLTFPDDIMPLGLVKLNFHRLYFCTNANHNHHFDPPEQVAYPPLVQGAAAVYQPVIQVVRPAFTLIDDASRRSTIFKLKPWKPASDDDSNDDDDDDDPRPLLEEKIGWEADDEEEEVQEEEEEEQGEERLDPIPEVEEEAVEGGERQKRAITDDVDEKAEDNKRVKRANSPLQPLVNNKAIRLSFEMSNKAFVGYGPRRGPHNISKMTLPQIVNCIDQVFFQWHNSTGSIHKKRPSIGLLQAYDAAAIAKMPARAALKAEAADLVIVVIRLPPGIGLGLDRAAQFRALGFRDAAFHVAVPKLLKRAVFGSSVAGGMSVFASSTAVNIKDNGQTLIAKAMKEARQNVAAPMFLMDPMVIVMPSKFIVTSFLQDFPIAYPNIWPYTEILLEELIQIVAKCLGLKGCKFYPNDYIQFVRHDKRIDVVLKENQLNDRSIPIESTYKIEFGSLEFASSWGLTSKTIVINTIYEAKSTGLGNVDFIYSADEEDDFGQNLKDSIAAQRIELKSQLVGNIASIIWRADNNVPTYIDYAVKNLAGQDQGAGRGLDDSDLGFLTDEDGGEALAQIQLDQDIAVPRQQQQLPQQEQEEQQPAVVVPAAPAGDDGDGGGAGNVIIGPVLNPLLIPQLVNIPNPNIQPPDNFIPFQNRDNGRCDQLPAVPNNLPDNFYIVSNEGEINSFIQDIGHISLAAGFSGGGNTVIDALSSKGCIVHNHERAPTLQFQIWSFSPSLFSLPIAGPTDGFIRAVVSCTPIQRLPGF